MNKQRFHDERSLNFHLIGNKNYDSHLRKLRDIYHKPKPAANLRRLVTAPQASEWNKRNRDFSYQHATMSRLC
jgi:hypothetical protein